MKKNYTVMLDARSMGRKPSGIGMYVYNMVLVLKTNPAIRIILISDVCESEQILEQKNSGIEVLLYGTVIDKNIGLVKYFKFVQQCINEYKPDIFWECNTLVPIRIKNDYGKLWVTIHDMFPITIKKAYGTKYYLYFRYGINKTLKYFDTVIFNSEETKNETIKCFPQMKDKNYHIAYMVIPNAPDIPQNDNNAFLYVGNLEYRKGTDILIESYLSYWKNGGTKALRLAGKIREKEIHDMLSRAMKTCDGIKYLGYISDDEKYKEYASCNTFVFPSRAEGFGTPIIEVMYYNKPIITSNLSIFDEITDSSTNTFNIFCNNLQNELENLMQRAHLSVNTKKYDELRNRYSVDGIGKILFGIIEKELQ